MELHLYLLEPGVHRVIIVINGEVKLTASLRTDDPAEAAASAIRQYLKEKK